MQNYTLSGENVHEQKNTTKIRVKLVLPCCLSRPRNPPRPVVASFRPRVVDCQSRRKDASAAVGVADPRLFEPEPKITFLQKKNRNELAFLNSRSLKIAWRILTLILSKECLT